MHRYRNSWLLDRGNSQRQAQKLLNFKDVQDRRRPEIGKQQPADDEKSARLNSELDLTDDLPKAFFSGNHEVVVNPRDDKTARHAEQNITAAMYKAKPKQGSTAEIAGIKIRCGSSSALGSNLRNTGHQGVAGKFYPGQSDQRSQQETIGEIKRGRTKISHKPGPRSNSTSPARSPTVRK